MKRRLLNKIAALSVFLFLLICLMWARSYSYADLLGLWKITRDAEGGISEKCRGVLSWDGIMTVGGGTAWESGEMYDRYQSAIPPSPVNRLGWTSWIDGWRDGIPPLWLDRFMDDENIFGFALHADNYSEPDGVYRMQRRVIQFPYWFIASLAAAMPMWWTMVTVAAAIRTARIRRLRERGLCVACRYNLTGNISGVCPECGAAIPATTGTEGATA